MTPSITSWMPPRPSTVIMIGAQPSSGIRQKILSTKISVAYAKLRAETTRPSTVIMRTGVSV